MYHERRGGGLASIEDSTYASIQLEDYIEKHEGGLIKATRNDDENRMDKTMTITRKQKSKENNCMDVFNV